MFRSLYNFTFLYVNYFTAGSTDRLTGYKTAPQEAFLLRGFLAAVISANDIFYIPHQNGGDLCTGRIALRVEDQAVAVVCAVHKARSVGPCQCFARIGAHLPGIREDGQVRRAEVS